MKKPDWKTVSVLAVFGFSVMMAPVFKAQITGALTRVYSVPDGAMFRVDGQLFSQATSAIWPEGSKHILLVDGTTQQTGPRSRLVFSKWQTEDKLGFALNPLPVTATSAITGYQAVFQPQYALELVLINCPDPNHCNPGGTVYVEGNPYSTTTEFYFDADRPVTLQAFPNDGYVFAGWAPGVNQTIRGYLNTVTMAAPMAIYPIFQPARKITLGTQPAGIGLKLYEDRTLVEAPVTMDWGMGSTHAVGANSPQSDQYGKWWVFQSWSDGGAANHSYTVDSSIAPGSLTATYIPAAVVNLLSSPDGMKILIDGQYNALNDRYFAWNVGDTHVLEAPAQQTDGSGRIWKFASWSNGATAKQNYLVPPESATTGVKLTVTYTPTSEFTVKSTVPGLTVKLDGADCATPCTVVRDTGTQVKVSVPVSVAQSESTRYDFDGWAGGSGGDVTVTLNDAVQTATASYHTMNRLRTATNPSNGANWTVAPVSADGFYPSSTNVAVSLSALPGFKFQRWDGDMTGSIPSGTVAMTAPRTVMAVMATVPYVPPAGVMNSAGATPAGGVAPGSIVSIFGLNLAGDTVVAADGMMPQALGGVSVTAGDRILPLFFVSPQQINFQLPDDMAEGTQSLTITIAGQVAIKATMNVVRTAPGVFQVADKDDYVAMVVHEDGSAVNSDSPAKTDELLTMYATGLGPVNTARPFGFPVPGDGDFTLQDSVTVQTGDAQLRQRRRSP